jgi:cytosine/adenosine deaminase-related metal-dependent hydrolase
MILRGARVALGPNRAKRLDIAVRGASITIELEGHMILPGLINAHDHLSFNLFPLLGRPPYANATEWARDIYHPDESPIREHRSIPREVRLAWGAIKNLVSGVTTVAHHDPDPPQALRHLPIRIAKASWAHSITFTPNLRRRFRGKRPFIIHAGEGTDIASRDEALTLDKLGVLGPRTAIVHGVGFGERGLRLIKRRRASLIVCPVSNLFTLRQTLSKSAFCSGIPIALGTDSALTAPGDLLDALRAARSVWNLSAARLYEMVTTIPAQILSLRDRSADLIVIQDPGSTPSEALVDLRRVEIVIVGGRIRLVSDRFAHLAPHSFEQLTVAERGRFFIDAPVRALYQEAAARLGTAPRLAGRRLRIK